MPRRAPAWFLVLTLAAVSCANRGDDATSTTTAAPAEAAPSTTSPSAPGTTEVATPEMFGTLESPCGPGDPQRPATVAEEDNGGDVIRVATASDKGALAAPGLNAELYDAAVAFAAWCNEQGGIRGLRLEVIDADAKLFEVPAVMERICAEAFAMVGGGVVFDDQEFPLFHECGMIDIAGYTVTAAKATSDGMVQPMPNPPNVKDAGWFHWAAEQYPDAVAHFATLTGDILTTQVVEAQYVEMMGTIPAFEIVDRIVYNSAGEATWAPIVQRLKDRGVRAMTFVGAPEVLALLLKAMDELGYRPELIIQEASFYVDSLIRQGGSSADGVIARTLYAPFEEADRYPGVAAYLDMMATHRPDGKVAGLGLQATSAYLLFAQSAGRCIDANNGVLTRACVLDEAAKVTDWTGGGMHAPTNPGTNQPGRCTVLMQVVDGTWRRLYPEIGSPDDTLGGWHCSPDDQVVQLQGDYGDTTAGKRP